MKRVLLGALALSMSVAASAAFAQDGAVGGAVGGAIVGGAVGGPVGATVGAVSGAAIGGIADDNRVRFRSYVTERRHPSYRYESDLRVGAVLPASGVTYYDVPAEYKIKKYRYTVVNDRAVLVEPGSRRVIQIID